MAMEELTSEIAKKLLMETEVPIEVDVADEAVTDADGGMLIDFEDATVIEVPTDIPFDSNLAE